YSGGGAKYESVVRGIRGGAHPRGGSAHWHQARDPVRPGDWQRLAPLRRISDRDAIRLHDYGIAQTGRRDLQHPVQTLPAIVLPRELRAAAWSNEFPALVRQQRPRITRTHRAGDLPCPDGRLRLRQIRLSLQECSV